MGNPGLPGHRSGLSLKPGWAVQDGGMNETWRRFSVLEHLHNKTFVFWRLRMRVI